MKIDDHVADASSSTTTTDCDEYYLLLNMEILKSMLDEIGSCPSCGCKLEVSNLINEKRGLACKLQFKCNSCTWRNSHYTSKKIETGKKAGDKPFGINYRTIVAFREIGKGHSAIETLCGFMNITPPMNNNSYTKAMKELYLSYRKKAIDNMESVATSVRKEKLGKEYSSDTIVNVDASFDGTWQRRGFSSMNGVVFVILKDSGQCVDYHVMSKKCSACEVWKGREWNR